MEEPEKVLSQQFPVVWEAVSSPGSTRCLDSARLRSYFKVLGFKDVPDSQLTAANLVRYLVLSDDAHFVLGSDGMFVTSQELAKQGEESKIKPKEESTKEDSKEDSKEESKFSLGLACRESTICGAGMGLFATRNYQKDDWVCVYFGRKVGFNERMKNSTTADKDYRLGL